MAVRAKFKCNQIKKNEGDTNRFISFSAVVADTKENKSWSKWTPAGDLTLNVSNPEAYNQFEEGKEYYLTIEEA